MKTIKILGTGCPKCKRTEAVVRETIANLGIEAEVQKVEDIQEIMSYNVLVTPVVVVDEEIKIKGRIPSIPEIEELLTA